jgi:methionyl-tRNA formyltransferase
LLNTVFFGTPAVAVPFLEKLHSLSRVKAVVTAPDKPAGRGYEVRPTPVKAAAARLGLPVLQPETLKTFSLDGLGPLDVGLVVAYGKLIPPAVFDAPRHGLVNAHFSLLPKYRGAGPVQWALIRGEKETGVSFFRIETGLDTGPLYLQRPLPVRPEDDAGTLMERLVSAGVGMMEELLKGPFEPRPQAGEPTLAPLLKKEDGLLKWGEKSSHELSDLVRGTSQWPGAFTYYQGKSVKVRRASPLEGGAGRPGALALERGKGVLVQCRSGRLLVERLQPEGKKEMSAEDFWNGFRPAPGDGFES